MRRAIAAIALTLSVQATLYAADWPRFRGPNADGLSPEMAINREWQQRPPKVLWQVPLGDSGYAGPSVSGGKLYIVDHQGDQDVVRALDLNSGDEVWRYPYKDATKEYEGFSRCTPVVDGDKVYTLSRLGTLVCLYAATGKALWWRNIIADFGGRLPQWQMAVSPLIDGNRLIVCPGGHKAVVALNKSTGGVLWMGGGSDPSGYATPVLATIGGKRQYVIFTGKSLIGVATNSGAVLWRFPWTTRFDVNAAAPIVIGNTVLITSGYDHGGALVDINGKRATARWKNKEFQSKFSTPLLYQGHAYVTTERGFLICLDVATGQVRWRQPGFEWGGGVGVGDTLIVQNGRGGDVVMVRFSPESYQEVGRVRPLSGRSWTAPIIAGGKLVVRNMQALACLDLK